MKTVILVCSSIFEMWSNLENITPGCSVKNRAVSGTVTSYWTEHLAAVLTAESPDVVLFYCGINDINNAVAAQDIIANTFHCRDLVHGLAPTTAFCYFSIIKAPQKIGKWDLIDRVNAAIQGGLSAGDLYVETNSVFFRNGMPIDHFFVEDGLHLKNEAYTALSGYVRPLLTTWIER